MQQAHVASQRTLHRYVWVFEARETHDTSLKCKIWSGRIIAEGNPFNKVHRLSCAETLRVMNLRGFHEQMLS